MLETFRGTAHEARNSPVPKQRPSNRRYLLFLMETYWNQLTRTKGDLSVHSYVADCRSTWGGPLEILEAAVAATLCEWLIHQASPGTREKPIALLESLFSRTAAFRDLK